MVGMISCWPPSTATSTPTPRAAEINREQLTDAARKRPESGDNSDNEPRTNNVKVELGIGFARAGFPFSDGAKLIAEYGQRRIFRDDWLTLFEPASVKEQVEMIVAGKLSGATPS